MAVVRLYRGKRRPYLFLNKLHVLCGASCRPIAESLSLQSLEDLEVCYEARVLAKSEQRRCVRERGPTKST